MSIENEQPVRPAISGAVIKTRAKTELKYVAMACALSFLCAGGSPARAQVAGATLSGVISDVSSAVVPGAQVSITNTATGSTREVTANGTGFYSAPNLLPGPYQVQVSAAGFRTVLQKSITLTVGAEETLNIKLQVGKMTQTVVVTAAPPSVQTSSSTMRATVESTTVRELPLNGRDWTSLATLQPGVVSIPNQATASFSANKGNRGFGNQLSNGGHRANENTYRVNGMVTNDYSNAAPGGATGVNLGVDAIDEFSVLTSTYTAEYGRTSGAVINAITKSGTNELHGTAYFFDRDSIFDARNYFDPATIPPFRRVQFGGSAGAPIVKDKTFIFGDYEGIRQSQSSLRIHPGSGRSQQGARRPRDYALSCPVAHSPRQARPDVNGIQSSTSRFRPGQARTTLLFAHDQKFSAADSLDGDILLRLRPARADRSAGKHCPPGFFAGGSCTARKKRTSSALRFANTVRGGVSRIIGDINRPVSGNSVATDKALAIAPGAMAPPQIPVSGLTTAYGLGGFNALQSRMDIHSGSTTMHSSLAARTRSKSDLPSKNALQRPGTAEPKRQDEHLRHAGQLSEQCAKAAERARSRAAPTKWVCARASSPDMYRTIGACQVESHPESWSAL